MKKIIASENDVKAMLDRLACEIVERYPNLNDYCLVGIKTRGAYLAKRLQERIEKITGTAPALAELDITFYRDDLTLVAQDPQMKSTSLGTEIEGKTVTAMQVVDYDGNNYLLYHLGSLDHVFKDSYVWFYGLPFDIISFENMGGGYTEAIVCGTCYIGGDAEAVE